MMECSSGCQNVIHHPDPSLRPNRQHIVAVHVESLTQIFPSLPFRQCRLPCMVAASPEQLPIPLARCNPGQHAGQVGGMMHTASPHSLQRHRYRQQQIVGCKELPDSGCHTLDKPVNRSIVSAQFPAQNRLAHRAIVEEEGGGGCLEWRRFQASSARAWCHAIRQ